MEIEILKTVENPLLSRKRVVAAATFDNETPKRVDVNQKIAAIIGVSPELVITKHIYTKFGDKKAKVISHIYSKVEDIEKIEEKYLVMKNKGEKLKKSSAGKAKAAKKGA